MTQAITETAAPATSGVGAGLARAASVLFLIGIAAVPFMQPFTVHLFGSAAQVADIVFALAGLAWAASVVLGGSTIRRGRFYLWIGLYFGAMLLTTALASQRSPARIAIQLYLLGLSVLAYNLVRTAKDVRRTWLVWAGTAAFSATAILISASLFYAIGLKDPKVNPVLWTAGSLPVGNYPRVRGFFLNGNMTGAYLAASACLVFGLAAMEPRRKKLLLAVGAATCAATLPTLSTALGGLALAIGLFAWVLAKEQPTWSGGRKVLFRAALPFAILGALFLLFGTAAYPKRTELGVVLEASPRWLTWSSSWETFLKHPLFGSGLGVPLADVFYQAPRGVLEHLTDPHNAWLSIAGQLGLVGLGAFLFLLVGLGRSLRPLTFRADPADAMAPQRIALAGAFLVIVYQAFSCSLEDMRHVWLIFGLIAGATTSTASQESPRSGSTT